MQTTERPAPTSAVAARPEPRAAVWPILWGSFILFCLLTAGTVFAVRAIWLNTTEAREATLTVSDAGTVLLKPARQTQWIGFSPPVTLHEGDTLRTDNAAQAEVTLLDGSLVRLYANAEVQLTRQASSKFTDRSAFIGLAVTEGLVQVEAAPKSTEARLLEVAVPGGMLVLQEGSYSIRTGPNRAHVRVMERGAADLQTRDRVYHLAAGERVEIGPTGVEGPLVSPEELILNGDFSSGMDGWEVAQTAGFQEGTDVSGQYTLMRDDFRNAVLFSRLGSKNTHFETQLVQRIDRDVSEFSELRLSLDMQIRYQSLSGGGYLGSEYPIRVRIDYRTLGGESYAVYGFYYQNNTRNRTDFGIPVPEDAWFTYAAAQNLMTLEPRPQRILSVQISASGWDYESRMSNISLAAK